MARWILAATTLVLASSACEAGPATEAPPPDDPVPAAAGAETLALPFELTERQASGRVIFETVCWTCHGTSGRGDGPAVEAGTVPRPPSFHADPIASLSAAELENRFRRALAGDDASHPHMRYVVSLLKAERFQDALSYVPAVTWPPEIPGSAMAGRARYERLCMACHGADGQGHGTAADVLLVPPARFPSDTLVAASDWDGLFRRIKEGGQGVHGSSMPPWGVMLTDEEVWDLVAYVASFQRDRLSPPPTG